jgi:hypothetical protein
MGELDNKNLQLKQIIVKDFFPPPKEEEKMEESCRRQNASHLLEGDD